MAYFKVAFLLHALAILAPPVVSSKTEAPIDGSRTDGLGKILSGVEVSKGDTSLENVEALKRIVKRLAPEKNGVSGQPGVDFPALTSIPATSFSCRGVKGGYYADLETNCQVFHICDNGRKISFLCPNGTIFHQSQLICDWWFKVECSKSEDFYESSSEQLAEEERKRAETKRNKYDYHRTAADKGGSRDYYDVQNLDYDGKQNGRVSPQFDEHPKPNQLQASRERGKLNRQYDSINNYNHQDADPLFADGKSDEFQNNGRNDQNYNNQQYRQQGARFSEDHEDQNRHTTLQPEFRVTVKKTHNYQSPPRNSNNAREDKVSLKRLKFKNARNHPSSVAPVSGTASTNPVRGTPSYTESTTFRSSTGQPYIKESQQFAESAAFVSNRGNRYNENAGTQHQFYYQLYPSRQIDDGGNGNSQSESTSASDESGSKGVENRESEKVSFTGKDEFSSGEQFATDEYKQRTETTVVTTESTIVGSTTPLSTTVTETIPYETTGQYYTTTTTSAPPCHTDKPPASGGSGDFGTTTSSPLESEYATLSSDHQTLSGHRESKSQDFSAHITDVEDFRTINDIFSTTPSVFSESTSYYENTEIFEDNRVTETDFVPTTEFVETTESYTTTTTTTPPDYRQTESSVGTEASHFSVTDFPAVSSGTSPFKNNEFEERSANPRVVPGEKGQYTSVTPQQYRQSVVIQEKFFTEKPSKTSAIPYRPNTITEKSLSPYDTSFTYKQGKVQSTLGPYVPFTKNYIAYTTPKPSSMVSRSNTASNASSSDSLHTPVKSLIPKLKQQISPNAAKGKDQSGGNVYLPEKEHALGMLNSLRNLIEETGVTGSKYPNTSTKVNYGLGAHGSSTLHSLALYFSTATDSFDSSETTDSSVIDDSEMEPKEKERNNSVPMAKKLESIQEVPSGLLTQHTITSYAELFKLNNALESNITAEDRGNEYDPDDYNEDLDVQQSSSSLEDQEKANTTKLRELAQVFTHALSAYLLDPDAFKKVLTEIRPTEPPRTTVEAANDQTMPTTTSYPTTVDDDGLISKEKGEVLDFSEDDSNELARLQVTSDYTTTETVPTTTEVAETTVDQDDSSTLTTEYHTSTTRLPTTKPTTVTTPKPMVSKQGIGSRNRVGGFQNNTASGTMHQGRSRTFGAVTFRENQVSTTTSPPPSRTHYSASFGWNRYPTSKKPEQQLAPPFYENRGRAFSVDSQDSGKQHRDYPHYLISPHSSTSPSSIHRGRGGTGVSAIRTTIAPPRHFELPTTRHYELPTSTPSRNYEPPINTVTPSHQYEPPLVSSQRSNKQFDLQTTALPSNNQFEAVTTTFAPNKLFESSASGFRLGKQFELKSSTPVPNNQFEPPPNTLAPNRHFEPPAVTVAPTDHYEPPLPTALPTRHFELPPTSIPSRLVDQPPKFVPSRHFETPINDQTYNRIRFFKSSQVNSGDSEETLLTARSSYAKYRNYNRVDINKEGNGKPSSTTAPASSTINSSQRPTEIPVTEITPRPRIRTTTSTTTTVRPTVVSIPRATNSPSIVTTLPPMTTDPSISDTTIYSTDNPNENKSQQDTTVTSKYGRLSNDHWTSSPIVTRLWETSVFIDPKHINHGLESDDGMTSTTTEIGTTQRTVRDGTAPSTPVEDDQGSQESSAEHPAGNEHESTWRWISKDKDPPTAFTLLPAVYSVESTGTPKPLITTRSSITTTITSSVTSTNSIPHEQFVASLLPYSAASGKLQFNGTEDDVARKLFGKLNTTSTDALINVMKQAEKNETVRQLVLLLISYCKDPANDTMEKQKDHLLDALLRMPVNEFASTQSKNIISSLNKNTVPIVKSRIGLNSTSLSKSNARRSSNSGMIAEASTHTGFRDRRTRKYRTTTEDSTSHVGRSDKIIASNTLNSLSEDDTTASDNRALELLRSLYTIANRWG